MNRKTQKTDGPPRKRQKLGGRGAHFYPPVHADDDVSYQRNLDLLKAETEKAKPSSDVLKELMHRTFPNRWDGYVTKSEPSTLSEYIVDFPLLKKATYVSKIVVTLLFFASIHILSCTSWFRLLWTSLLCVIRKTFGKRSRSSFLCGWELSSCTARTHKLNRQHCRKRLPATLMICQKVCHKLLMQTCQLLRICCVVHSFNVFL